ncbi:MAG: HAD-IA family hydrolase [Gemmatimonadaceae bacterium]
MSDTGSHAQNIETILFDVGGVLGTNGWDHTDRAGACRVFGLECEEFEVLHQEVFDAWERGDMTMDEYLDIVVFSQPRSFTRQSFRDFMFAQSVPHREMLDYAAALMATHRYTMMLMNNEAAELNAYRVRTFGLRPLFSAFLSSCYLGYRKPAGAFYDRALAIAHVNPDTTVFIDDREENLVPVRERGVHTVHATGLAAVQAGLAELGVITFTQ